MFENHFLKVAEGAIGEFSDAYLGGVIESDHVKIGVVAVTSLLLTYLVRLVGGRVLAPVGRKAVSLATLPFRWFHRRFLAYSELFEAIHLSLWQKDSLIVDLSKDEIRAPGNVLIRCKRYHNDGKIAFFTLDDITIDSLHCLPYLPDVERRTLTGIVSRFLVKIWRDNEKRDLDEFGAYAMESVKKDLSGY